MPGFYTQEVARTQPGRICAQPREADREAEKSHVGSSLEDGVRRRWSVHESATGAKQKEQRGDEATG